jgi:hypothetical protein
VPTRVALGPHITGGPLTASRIDEPISATTIDRGARTAEDPRGNAPADSFDKRGENGAAELDDITR